MRFRPKIGSRAHAFGDEKGVEHEGNEAASGQLAAQNQQATNPEGDERGPFPAEERKRIAERITSDAPAGPFLLRPQLLRVSFLLRLFLAEGADRSDAADRFLR